MGSDAGAPDPRPDSVSVLVTRAAALLRRWDSARAAAYARGSVRALRDLYAAPAGRADVRLLRSYLGRGYRVEGVRMQLLAVEVLDHRPGRWLLRVTDRLAGAAAVGHGRRVALPRDRAERQDVALVRGRDGIWRMGEVSEGPPPAPTPRSGAGR